MSAARSMNPSPRSDRGSPTDPHRTPGCTALLHVHLKPAAEEAVRAGHPWVYDQSIRKQNRPGRPGEPAALYDRKNRFLAIGLFDPDSPLRIRVLHRGNPVPLDDAWWRERLHRAASRRLGLFDTQTTGCRLVHGESDGWPGLVLDRYGPVLVLNLYTAAWLPWLDSLQSWITGLFHPRNLVLRLSRNIQSLAAQRGAPPDGTVLHGPPLDQPVPFLESGLTFEADVLRGQKTGFFLDQRENRRKVESLAAGRAVLNLFSYSGGFSIYAARGGAESVTDLDLNPHALEAARHHFALNRPQFPNPRTTHHTIRADAFEWLNRAPAASHDLVVVDPPALARQAAERTAALRAYRHLVQRAARLVRAGGILVACSCTAHIRPAEFFELVRETLRHTRTRWRELCLTTQPSDHPAAFPEAEYLKAIYLQAANQPAQP